MVRWKVTRMFADLDGRVAVVTGAAQGIGLEYARGLAGAGCRVVVADLRTAGELPAGAAFVRTDVTDEASVHGLADETTRRFGRLDVLVNNAGLYGGVRGKAWDEIEPEEWERMLRVNVTGSWLAARACARPMKVQRDGRIINIASGVALSPRPGFAHYNVSKAAVIGLTRSLARELGDHGVRVNAVSPGLVWNDASRGQVSEAYAQARLAQRCLKRHMLPADLVGTVLYLASDASGFLTGQNLVVDGGQVFH